jgi:hypothetical protein
VNPLLRSIALAAFVAALSIPRPGDAQQSGGMPGMRMPGTSRPSTGMPGMEMGETLSAAPYHPGLGELMTAFVQPRHIKLGLAGAARNWAYAAYELDELRETFEDVGRLVLKHGSLEIAPATAATVRRPMAALDRAIRERDSAAFAVSYAQLTAGCNACHQSAGHPMIVIRAPTGTAPFPDQDFQPAR